MKIHLGCGSKYIDGYIHIDAQKFDHIDHVADIKKLDFLKANTADEIYACHVLEHFGRNEFRDVLNEWIRVLKPGGTLRLSVPDFDAIFMDYSKTGDLSPLMGLIYGGQRNKYDYHFFGFNFKSLSTVLSDLGMINIQRYSTFDFLNDEFDDFSKAHLPHMDFQNGRLMSLNVISNKS